MIEIKFTLKLERDGYRKLVSKYGNAYDVAETLSEPLIDGVIKEVGEGTPFSLKTKIDIHAFQYEKTSG